MAYLVPYHIILKPSDTGVTNRGFILQQEGPYS